MDIYALEGTQKYSSYSPQMSFIVIIFLLPIVTFALFSYKECFKI